MAGIFIVYSGCRIALPLALELCLALGSTKRSLSGYPRGGLSASDCVLLVIFLNMTPLWGDEHSAADDVL